MWEAEPARRAGAAAIVSAPGYRLANVSQGE
jgi:hypothetical protein